MAKRVLDLPKLLPTRYRDKTIDTFIENTIAHQLTRDDTQLLYGYVGSEERRAQGDLYLTETELERNLNQLQAVYDVTLGTERSSLSWSDFMQRMVTLGVDIRYLDQWLTLDAHNFAPPVSFDKLINYNQYLWVGPWVQQNPTEVAFVNDLRFAPDADIAAAFAVSNANYAPEYYTIQRGQISAGAMVQPYPFSYAGWSPWSVCNLWIHKDDAIAFVLDHPEYKLADLLVAKMPIIEYDVNLKLNEFIDGDGDPSDSAGTARIQTKVSRNQPPQFDLYYALTGNGEHTKQTSSLFWFDENQQSPVDPILGRRIKRDDQNDLYFSHAFVEEGTDRLLWSKRWNGSTFVLKTIWSNEKAAQPMYFSKYDIVGTVINVDKFTNYRNYYWIGPSISPASSLPTWNPTGLAEYTVIEKDGTSDWSVHNYWFHASELQVQSLPFYHRATKPIIEFNQALEAELTGPQTSLHQLPVFTRYLYNTNTKVYDVVPASVNSKANDSFTNGRLLCRFDDLPLILQLMIDGTPEVAARLCFTAINGERFVCTLASGEFVTQTSSTVYGYTPRVIYTGPNVGDGSITSLSATASATPMGLTISFTSPTSYSVTVSTDGSLGAGIVGIPLTINFITFTLTPGTIPFATGDTFFVENKSIVFEPINYHVKLDSTYRTFMTAVGITTDVTSNQKVAANPLMGNGAWEVPASFKQNLNNETRSTLKEGDLADHLVTVLEAQVGFIGSAIGTNNSRTLALNPSLGGLIKQYDKRLPLLLGLLAQRDFTAQDLFEFSSRSYEQLLNKVREFVELEIVDRLETIPVLGSGVNTLDDSVLADCITYIEQSFTSALEVDRPFHLSTMPIKGLALTAPYLGLQSRHQPEEVLDTYLNIPSLRHHDGHLSPLATVDFSILKRIVQRKIVRSNGQTTSGYVGGPVPINKPFAKHLWLNLSNSSLYIYDVLTDTGAMGLPATALIGQYAYDRNLGEVWQYNGTWVSLGTTPTVQNMPWRQVDLTKTLRALLLGIEQILYEHVDTGTITINPTALEANALWGSSMQIEFEDWATGQGVDPYDVMYDASNAFTWNFTNIIPTAPATWQEIYAIEYGTPRPDLEPWIPAGLSEAAWLADAVTAGHLPGGTVVWDTNLWSSSGLGAWQSGLLVGQGRSSKLSIDLSTGELIPPYANGHSQQLFLTPPPTPRAPFVFGDNGSIELLWRSSLAYKTAASISYFRVDPLDYVTKVWGETQINVNNFSFLDKTGNKPAIASTQLHGEIEIERDITLSASVVPVLPNVYTPYSYALTYVALDVFKVTRYLTGVKPTAVSEEVVAFTNSTYTNAYFSFTAPSLIRGLNIGDRFEIVNDLGAVSLVGIPTKYKLLQGFGQLFSQLVRSTGSDETLSSSSDLLRGWRMSLAYNSGKIIDSSLGLKINDAPLADGTFDLLLKERYFASLGWYSSLKVELKRIGTTERRSGVLIPGAGLPGTQRGDDWVFEVSGYMPDKTKITLHGLDTGSARTTFFALSALHSKDEWTRPVTSSATQTVAFPITITGLQATVDFLFQVVAYYKSKGFVVDGENELPVDSKTNRPRDWQLLVEEFIDQQFGGVPEGSSFLLDPLGGKILFRPKDGVLSQIVPLRTRTNVYSNVYDINGKPLNGSRVFRTSTLSTIVPPEQVFSARFTTSQFEHTILLDDTSGSVLIFDPFLNHSADRMFLTGRFSFNNWRPESGGRFLTAGKFEHSIEGSLQDIKELYDSSIETLDDPAKQRARALLGYVSKDYYKSRNAPELTQFRFWQGALKAKGTNRAVEAFVNAKQYQTASIDEYWAYKYAEYGDARQTTDVEIKLQPNDSYAERTNLLFLESDEIQKLADDSEITDVDFYDADGFDVHPYDTAVLSVPSYNSIYTSSQQDIMEPNNVHSAVLIRPTDETRWFRYDELGSLQYLEADLLYVANFIPDSLDRCYLIIDPKTGEPVNADAFELIDTALLVGSDAYDVPLYDTVPFGGEAGAIYYETGELINNTSPVSYTVPKFRRLNHAVIKIDDSLLLGRNIQVRCYGPAIKKFSPNKLLTYNKIADQTITNDIFWWDPARGSHSPEAHALVNLQTKIDPAVYNSALVREKSTDKARPWGKNQVGKVWWDTHISEWLPYSDTKIRPEFDARVSAWGALKDFGEIALYEWIESAVAPLDYDKLSDTQKAGSTVGFINKIFRTRTWKARPVLWSYTNDPQLTLWKPLKLGTAELANNEDLLYAPTGSLPVFAIGEKIALAYFSTFEKNIANLNSVSGMLVIRSDRALKVGSTGSPTTPVFPTEVCTSGHIVKIQENSFSLASSSSVVKLTYEFDVVPYLRITLGDQKTQRVTLANTPIDSNTLIELSFDQLGLTIIANCIRSRAETWPIGISTTPAQRLTSVFQELATADIVVRQAYATETLITMPSATLPILNGNAEEFSWASWIDPTSFELSNDNLAPFNKWKALPGKYTELEQITLAAAQEIKDRFESPWEFQPYMPVWSAWQIAKLTLLRTTYCTFGQTHLQSLQTLQFRALEQQARRARAYINGLLVPHGTTLNQLNTGYYDVPPSDTSPYDSDSTIPTWYFDIDPALLRQGDEVVVIVPPYEPSVKQLALDLSSADADPIILTEWKLDAPHVTIDHRSTIGTSGKTLYYFWVRNKETAPYGETMSIALAENLLRRHDNFFGVPQIYKFFNQVDGRPNRYGLLSVRGLSWSVILQDLFKIRIKRIASMRDNDEDLILKPIHAEWKLIRAGQPTRVPFELWSVLVDTLCGESLSGQELPALAYTDYDSRGNIIPASWGFGLPRALCPSGVARDTFKNTVLAPTTTKYSPTQQRMIVNPLSYAGFDVTQLDAYLSTPTSIRKFMGSIWKNADAKQINELFFAILEDSLAHTRELPGLFKTSFIAVDDVRTSNIIEDNIL